MTESITYNTKDLTLNLKKAKNCNYNELQEIKKSSEYYCYSF